MDDETVVVYRSQGPLEAEVVLSKLASEGVLAYLRYEAVGRTLGLTINGLGLVEVLVAEADAERAREILDTGAEDKGAGDEPEDEDANEGDEEDER